MKLINMANTDKDSDKSELCCDVSEDKYPWGLQIDLDEESIKKLGIKNLPEINQELSLEATVTVKRLSSSDSSDGGERRSLTLQITSMAIEGEKTDFVKTLYGKGDK